MISCIQAIVFCANNECFVYNFKTLAVENNIVINTNNLFSEKYLITGATNVIGVESTNPNSFVVLKTSTCSGSTSDIKQPSGLTNPVIQLNATDLQNATADSNGFTVNTEPNHIYFCLTSQVNFTGSGSAVDTPIGTYYLSPGSQIANFSSGIVGYPFVQKVIIFEGLLSATTNLTGLQTITVTFYKSTSPNVLGTSFAGPLVINVGTQITKFQNKCTTFNPLTDFLQIQCVISGANLTAGNNVCVAIAGY